jgi:cardiolipin synthase
MRQVEDHYRSLSHELTLEEWERRPLGKRYIDNVMRLTSALQ